jgi:hypothetical protein
MTALACPAPNKMGAGGRSGPLQLCIAKLIRRTPPALAVVELHLIGHATLF